MGQRLEKFLKKVSSRLPERIITGRNAADVYLRRFYICGPIDRPDNYWPKPKERLAWLPFTIFLHFFERGDDDRALHNHPWEWCLSWILSGGYWEAYRVLWSWTPEKKHYDVLTHLVKPGKFNFFRANHFHHVTLRDGGRKKCWTLFIAGPRVQSWGFWNQVTHEYKDWRTFLEEKANAKQN